MRKKSSPLRVEQMEAREVPAWTSLSGGTLSVYGTDAGERITLSDNQFGSITVNGWAVASAAAVARVNVYGFGGNDVIDVRNLTSKPVAVDGGSGADVTQTALQTRLTLTNFSPAAGDAVQYNNVLLRRQVVAANGSVWAQTLNGELWSGGRRQLTNVQEFRFDAAGRVVVLDGRNTLTRSSRAYDLTWSDFMGVNVRQGKWQIARDSTVYALQTDGQLMRNGAMSWSRKADFAILPDNRILLLDIPADGGRLWLSRGAYGNNFGLGWLNMGVGVKKYTVAADSTVYALQNDGVLKRNGTMSWTNKADFTILPNNRLILLDTRANGGTLSLSRGAYGNNFGLGWITVARNVRTYTVSASGTISWTSW